MKRIICHWTAGAHKASDFDREHYHYLVEGDGKVVLGKFTPEANLQTKPGIYAAHTLNGNTGSIGVAVCCMAGAVERPFFSGKYPMTKVQWDAMAKLVAAKCRQYGIAVTPQTVLSHAEVAANLGIPQRGKWDIARLSFNPSEIGAKACGDYLRREVSRHLGDVASNESDQARHAPEVWPPFPRGVLASPADYETPEPSTPKGMLKMTAEQIGAIVRTVVQLVAGLAIAKGIGDDALWMTIGGAAASVVSGAWSFFWIKKAST